jgi:lysozyme
MTYSVLGTDVSFWQDAPSTAKHIDFAKMKANGAEFVIIRTGQDGHGKDRDMDYNIQAAHDAGLIVGTYYMLDTHTLAGTTQADTYWSYVSKYKDIIDLPLVADYEYYHWVARPSVSVCKEMLKSFLSQIQVLSGEVPMIYTNVDSWKRFGGSEPYWAKYPLWLASYLTGTPVVPAPFPKWTFWQFTDKGKGLDYGVESLQIDLNYWYGTKEELYSFCGKQPVLDTCCAYCLETRKRLEQLEKIAGITPISGL